MTRKTPDISEIPASLARGAAEAKGRLLHTAEFVDAEWKRLVAMIERSEAVPAPVKQVTGEIRTLAGNLTSVVVRSAAQVGLPIPGRPAPAEASAEPVTDAAAEGAVEAAVGAAAGSPEKAVGEEPAPGATAADGAAAADSGADEVAKPARRARSSVAKAKVAATAAAKPAAKAGAKAASKAGAKAGARPKAEAEPAVADSTN